MKKLIYSFLMIFFLTAALVSCAPEGENYSFDNPYDPVYNDQPDTSFTSISSISKTYKIDGIHRNPLTFSWDGSDDDGLVTGFLYQMDEGEWLPTSATFVIYSTLTTGIHAFAVKSGDDKGAFDLTPYEVSFAVDATLPSVSFTTPRHNAADVNAVNASITATFNEEVDGATIIFTLLDGLGDPVAGTLDYIYNTARFTPLADLGNGATYSASISSSVSDKVGNSMPFDYNWSFAVYSSDLMSPEVSSTAPSRNGTIVAVDSAITATFSEEMTAFSISTSTFKLQDEFGNPVEGAVSYSGVTASFKPVGFLAYSASYTASISTGAKDLASNPLSSQYQWSFTTGIEPDIIEPVVSFTDPRHNDVDIEVNSAISAAFNEFVDAMTINTDTFKLIDNSSGLPVAGVVTNSGTTATFTSFTSLKYSTLFTASISTGVKDLAGNPLAGIYEWDFTTGVAPDLTPPAVTSTVPARDTSGAAINSSVTARFSESLDPLTVSTVTFTLKDEDFESPVVGSVIYNGASAAFSPFSSLQSSTWYIATVKAEIRDVAGNPMDSDYSWRFKTSDGPDVSSLVVLGTAPSKNATVVPVNISVVVTFNEPVEPSTVTNTTFMLRDESLNPVKGTVSYSGLSAIFVPYSSLKPWHEYMALVSDLITDTAGNQMSEDYYWSFLTGDSADVTAPTATVVSPLDGYSSVTIDSLLIISFSEPMDGTTINTESFSLLESGVAVAGNVYYDGSDVAIFEPLSSLSPGPHTAALTTGVKDLAGNYLSSELLWSFDVVDSLDITPPFVLISSLIPAKEATSVDVNSYIFVEFSEPMEGSFIDLSTFTVSDGVSNIEGSVFYDGVLTAMFIPAEPLTYSSYYTVTLTSDIRDRAGNTLQSPGFAWAFGTGELPLNISSSIAGGGFHSLAVKSDLSLAAWGYNTNGELGDGTTNISLTPVQTLNLTGVIASAAGDNHSMALLTDKTVSVWGDNTLGQLGIGTPDNETHTVPVELGGISDVVSLAAGSFHSMALKSNGTVWTWGDNNRGQLGDGTIDDKALPAKVLDPGDASGYLQGVVAIAAGEYHSLAVKNDGTVWTWGWNTAGQLGDGSTDNSSIPVTVSGLSNVKEVAAGSFHSLALQADGTVWSWGWNGMGQLGDGTIDDSWTPVEVSGLTGVTAISSGSLHSMALKDGLISTWGLNSSGQLGNPAIVDISNAPVQVSGLTAVTAIAGGYLHSISLRVDGSVWTWGYNSSGQLGDDSQIDSFVPIKVTW